MSVSSQAAGSAFGSQLPYAPVSRSHPAA